MTPQDEKEMEQATPDQMTGEELAQVSGGKPPYPVPVRAGTRNSVKYMAIEMDQVVISKVSGGGEKP